MEQIHYRQSDVRTGAELLARYRKGVRLERGQEITRPLYVAWVEFRNRFHHAHSLEDDATLYLSQHPEINRQIRV
jgi:hypothetical protein